MWLERALSAAIFEHVWDRYRRGQAGEQPPVQRGLDTYEDEDDEDYEDEDSWFAAGGHEMAKTNDVDGAAPLTASEKKALAKAADELWKEKTADLRQRRKEMAGGILQYRYDVGLFAVEVIADKAKESNNRLYGSHTVEDLGKDIGESASTIHSCIKFAQRVTPDELAHFKDHEYPWRAVQSLITVDDAKSYASLKKQFEKGQFENSDDLKAAVKEVNDAGREDGTKPDKRRGGGQTTASMVKSFNTMLNQATSKVIPGMVRAVAEFKKKGDEMSESAAEAVAAGIKEAKKNIKAARTLLDKTEKAIEESGV